mgnify:CR=1 FL=1
MKSIWKVMLAVCCLGMTIGCGTNPSKNENVKEHYRHWWSMVRS